jgi:hypothetical protein
MRESFGWQGLRIAWEAHRKPAQIAARLRAEAERDRKEVEALHVVLSHAKAKDARAIKTRILMLLREAGEKRARARRLEARRSPEMSNEIKDLAGGVRK